MSRCSALASKADQALSKLNLKYLLLAFTLGTWLVADAVCWWFRPQGAIWPPERYEYYRTSLLLAIWVAQSQLVACLLPLLSSRLSWRTILVVLAVVDANCVQMWYPTKPPDDRAELLQLALAQLILLFPLAGFLRSFGLRLVQNVWNPAAGPHGVRQFGLSRLMLWTAGTAVYCLLLRQVHFELYASGSLLEIALMIGLPFCLAILTLRAALGGRRLLARSAALAGLLIGIPLLLEALLNDVHTTFADIFAAICGPTLLVWLTCLTLRAFGWRLVWQRAQPASSEPLAVPKEIA